MAAVDVHNLLAYWSPSFCVKLSSLTSNPVLDAATIQRVLEEPQVGRSPKVSDASMISLLTAISSWLRTAATNLSNSQADSYLGLAKSEALTQRIAGISGLSRSVVWSRLEELTSHNESGVLVTQGTGSSRVTCDQDRQLHLDVATVWNQIANEVDAWRVAGPPWWP